MASLLNVVVDFQLTEHLDLLLKRGADPNGGPTPDTEFSPLEFAFCSTLHHSHGYCACLKRLLEAPDIRKTPTTEILNAWGQLEEDAEPEAQECCRLLYEAITGQSTHPEDPLPYPPQLTLDYTLGRGNWWLAARISGDRPITEEEKTAVLHRYAQYHRISIQRENNRDFRNAQQYNQIRILTNFLAQYPETLNTPEVRSAVAALTVALPEADEELQQWAEQLEDGPVLLKELPIICCPDHAFWDELEPEFFPRWDERLGRGIKPVLLQSTGLHMQHLSPEDITVILQRVTLLGDPASPDTISQLVMQALQDSPEEVFCQLLQPDGPILQLPANALLDACQSLPLSRRSLLLPHLHKEMDYGL